MKTPREIARELMDYISKCACEESPCSCGFSRDCRLIEQALIAYGNEKIEECVKLAMNRLAGLSEMYNSKEERGWDRGELAFRQIEARTIIDEIRALKTKKEGER